MTRPAGVGRTPSARPLRKSAGDFHSWKSTGASAVAGAAMTGTADRDIASAADRAAVTRRNGCARMPRIFLAVQGHVNSSRMSSAHARRTVGSAAVLFLQFRQEVGPELFHAALVADAQLHRLDLPAVGVVDDLRALLLVRVGPRPVRLAAVTGELQQVLAGAEVQEEQLQQAEVAYLRRLLGRRREPVAQRLAARREDRVRPAPPAALLDVLADQPVGHQAGGLVVQLGVRERPEVPDGVRDPLLEVVAGRGRVAQHSQHDVRSRGQLPHTGFGHVADDTDLRRSVPTIWFRPNAKSQHPPLPHNAPHQQFLPTNNVGYDYDDPTPTMQQTAYHRLPAPRTPPFPELEGQGRPPPSRARTHDTPHPRTRGSRPPTAVACPHPGHPPSVTSSPEATNRHLRGT